MTDSLSESLAKRIKETIDENDLPDKYKDEIDAIVKEKDKTPDESPSKDQDDKLII
jgi:hypothetical protein